MSYYTSTFLRAPQAERSMAAAVTKLVIGLDPLAGSIGAITQDDNLLGINT
jgi:hypothetical protein